MADDVIGYLKCEKPELSAFFDAQTMGRMSDAEPERMAVEPLAAVSVLAAIVFLLSSHIEFKGSKFKFEKSQRTAKR